MQVEIMKKRLPIEYERNNSKSWIQIGKFSFGFVLKKFKLAIIPLKHTVGILIVISFFFALFLLAFLTIYVPD